MTYVSARYAHTAQSCRRAGNKYPPRASTSLKPNPLDFARTQVVLDDTHYPNHFPGVGGPAEKSRSGTNYFSTGGPDAKRTEITMRKVRQVLIPLFAVILIPSAMLYAQVT